MRPFFWFPLSALLIATAGCSSTPSSSPSQAGRSYPEVVEDALSSPDLALAALKEGNQRFVSGRALDQNFRD